MPLQEIIFSIVSAVPFTQRHMCIYGLHLFSLGSLVEIFYYLCFYNLLLGISQGSNEQNDKLREIRFKKRLNFDH